VLPRPVNGQETALLSITTDLMESSGPALASLRFVVSPSCRADEWRARGRGGRTVSAGAEATGSGSTVGSLSFVVSYGLQQDGLSDMCKMASADAPVVHGSNAGRTFFKVWR
jgi:hypothetical protein